MSGMTKVEWTDLLSGDAADAPAVNDAQSMTRLAW